MFWNRWYCAFKSILGGWPFDFYTSGHIFQDTERHDRVYLQLSECIYCGKQHFSWTEYPPRTPK